jgi:hypothetical protein
MTTKSDSLLSGVAWEADLADEGLAMKSTPSKMDARRRVENYKELKRLRRLLDEPDYEFDDEWF